MDYCIMFDVLEGGVSEPIQWGKENLATDRNIIILDEGSSSLFLWHGTKQGLVARRTALRQAESLKGHGYIVGKSIIGRDIKDLKEIDQRKIGRDPETDKLNEELQTILNREVKNLDNFIVTFSLTEEEAISFKPVAEQKLIPKPVIVKEIPTVQPQAPVYHPTPVQMPKSLEKPIVANKPDLNVASEYDEKSVVIPKPISEPSPILKQEPTSTPVVKESPSQGLDLLTQGRIGFVIMSIMDHYDDIWVSKKEDGSIAVEMMDGPICQFSIKDGSKISFTSNSFSGLATKVKTEIQKKFVELSKLL